MSPIATPEGFVPMKDPFKQSLYYEEIKARASMCGQPGPAPYVAEMTRQALEERARQQEALEILPAQVNTVTALIEN